MQSLQKKHEQPRETTAEGRKQTSVRLWEHVRALRPVVQQPLHQPSDRGDERDPALPPRLSLDLLQQAAGQRRATRQRGVRTRRDTKASDRKEERAVKEVAMGENTKKENDTKQRGNQSQSCQCHLCIAGFPAGVSTDK